MTAGELKAALDKVIAKAEERKHDAFLGEDWEDIDSPSWARIVRLMNLGTACRQVKNLLDKCNLTDEEF